MEKCCLCEGRVVNGRCTACGMLMPDERELYWLNKTRPAGKPARGGSGTDGRRPERETASRRREAPPSGAGRPQGGGVRKTSVQRPAGMAGGGEGAKRTYRTYTPGGRASAPQSRRRPDARSGKSGGWVWLLVGIAAAAAIAAKGIDFLRTHEVDLNPLHLFEEGKDSKDSYLDEDYSPYEWVKRQLASEGEEFSETFDGGIYTVGWQIPEGSYTVEAEADSDLWLWVEDDENDISISEWLSGMEENSEYSVEKKEDLWLYEGASVMIDGTGELRLTSQNAQLEALQEPMPNPLTETVSIQAEKEAGQNYVAGTDFPAGTYDIRLVFGNAQCEIMGSDPGDDREFSMDSDYGNQEMKNIFLEAGTVLRVETYSADGALMELVPSPELYQE